METMIQKILILTIIAALGGACAARMPDAGANTTAATSSLSLENAAALKTTESSTTWPEEAGFVIGPGDVVDIAVWKDEALTRSCVVRPDGIITFPLIG